MGLGYSGKVLFVDLSTKAIDIRRIREGVYLHYLGGSGLGVKLLTELGDPTIHPLDQRNPLPFLLPSGEKARLRGEGRINRMFLRLITEST